MSDVPVSSAPSAPVSSPAPSSTPSSGASPSPSSPSPQAKSVSSPVGSSDTAPVSDKPVAGETPAEAAERKYKLKVNGAEREYSEQEVLRRAQHFESAEQKYQEAAQTRKQVEAFVEALRTDPMKVLANPDLGINFRELAETYLAKEFQKEMMSPEQIELEELRAFKAEQERVRQEAEQHSAVTAQQAEFQRIQKHYTEDYDRKIREGLDKSGLPRNPQTLKRVAELMYNAVKKGYDLDVNTAVDMVRESYQSDVSQLFGGLDGEKLLGVLGEDIAKKIRMYDLQRLKAKMQPPPAPEPTPTGSAQPREVNKQPAGMRTDEWIASLRKRAGIE